jgi:hypothetical protein
LTKSKSSAPASVSPVIIDVAAVPLLDDTAVDVNAAVLVVGKNGEDRGAEKFTESCEFFNGIPCVDELQGNVWLLPL